MMEENRQKNYYDERKQIEKLLGWNKMDRKIENTEESPG